MQIRALILENTFLSLPRLVPSVLPVLAPFAFLCHQKWDSASTVPLIPPTTPILMLSGARDEVVPREHMLGLWQIVKAREGGSKTESRNGSRGGQESPEEETPEDVHDVRTGAGSRFVNFPRGTHSKCRQYWVPRAGVLTGCANIDDTCVQQGYWMIVAEFVAGLGNSTTQSGASSSHG